MRSHQLKCDRWAPLLYSSLFYFIFFFSDKHSSFSLFTLTRTLLLFALSFSLTLSPSSSHLPFEKIGASKETHKPSRREGGNPKIRTDQAQEPVTSIVVFLEQCCSVKSVFFPCYNFFYKTLWSTEIYVYASFVLCVRTLNFFSCYAF